MPTPDEDLPDGYVERVCRAFPDALLTIAKQAVIAGYERGSLTEEQTQAIFDQFGLDSA